MLVAIAKHNGIKNTKYGKIWNAKTHFFASTESGLCLWSDLETEFLHCINSCV